MVRGFAMRTEPRTRGWRGHVAIAIAMGALHAAASPAQAQLVQACGGEVSTPELISTCATAVATLEGLRDGLGVGHAGAAPLPGTSSALGRRFRATPRVSLAARAGLVRFNRANPDSWSTRAASAEWATVLGLSAGVGLFDGFSPAPTVSGLLGLDLLADLSTVRLPSDGGFTGASVAWGYGLRLGILRESFTLPGAYLSVMRRSGASATLAGDEGSLDADFVTTSLRGVVGKEILGFGLHGGAGWDRTSAEGVFGAAPGGGPAVVTEFDGESATRFVVFGGLTRTFLVTSFGLDVGRTDGVTFGSLSIRLTI